MNNENTAYTLFRFLKENVEVEDLKTSTAQAFSVAEGKLPKDPASVTNPREEIQQLCEKKGKYAGDYKFKNWDFIQDNLFLTVLHIPTGITYAGDLEKYPPENIVDEFDDAGTEADEGCGPFTVVEGDTPQESLLLTVKDCSDGSIYSGTLEEVPEDDDDDDLEESKFSSVKSTTEPFKSDDEIEKEFSDFKVTNILLKGDSFGWIDIDFPNAGDSVGGGTDSVSSRWMIDENDKVILDDWYPDSVYLPLAKKIKDFWTAEKAKRLKMEESFEKSVREELTKREPKKDRVIKTANADITPTPEEPKIISDLKKQSPDVCKLTQNEDGVDPNTVKKADEGKVPDNPANIEDPKEQIQNLCEERVLTTVSDEAVAKDIQSKYPGSRVVNDMVNGKKQFIIMVKEGKEEEKQEDAPKQEECTCPCSDDRKPVEETIIEEDTQTIAEKLYVSQLLKIKKTLTEKEANFIKDVEAIKLDEKQKADVEEKLQLLKSRKK